MKKLIIYAVVLGALLMGLLGFVSISKMIQISEVTKKMYNHPFTVTNATKSIVSITHEIDLELMQLNESELSEDTLKQIINDVRFKEAEVDRLFNVVLQRYLGNLSDIETIYIQFKKGVQEHEALFEFLKNGEMDKVRQLLKSKKNEEVRNMGQIITFADNKAIEFYNESIQLRDDVLKLLIIISGLIIILFLSGGSAILRMIMKHEKDLMNQKTALSDANFQMKLAQESAGFGIWDYHFSSGKLLWDDWMLKLYGMERSDFQEDFQSWAKKLHAEDSEGTLEAFKKAVNGEKKYDIVFRIHKTEGEVRYLGGKGVVLRNGEGEAVRMIGINYDVTDIIKNEEELRERNMAMIQQSRLAQMGEMISMIAHQWRQPLSAIAATGLHMKLGLELDADQLDDKEKRISFIAQSINSLNDIGIFVRNLTTTIDDFRTFYKPDKRSLPVPLYQPIQKAFHMVHESLRSDNIVCDINCNEKIIVLVFENEIIQVLMSLLKNAQDNFKEKGIKSAEIYINCEIVGPDVMLSICDNGGGIKTDIISKVFDPYFTTKDEKNGTGLGLYMSKKIIEDHHHGTLTVENREKGCCFIICLPMEKE